MIEKMKYVNMMGSISDMDRVIEKYISKAEIQLEYTYKELAHEKDLLAFNYTNPYADIYKTAESLYNLCGKPPVPSYDMGKDETIAYIKEAAERVEVLTQDLKGLHEKRESYVNLLNRLEPFRELEFDIKTVGMFEFIKYKFGRMPLASFKQFEAYLYGEPEILFVFGKNDGVYVYGVYFVCDFLLDKYESVFSSLYFEKIDFPFLLEDDDFSDTPMNIYMKYSSLLSALDMEIRESESKLMERADTSASDVIVKNKIAASYHKAKELHTGYDIRKYAAKTKNDYYILVGWMTEKEAARFSKEVEDDEEVIFIIEDDNDAIPSLPPTKLKNPMFIRPFEFFVRMYGLPSYNEIEPTPFVALTYTLLFGIMFGDVGQGAVISLLGLYLGKVKKLALGSVMAIIGISSMFFGLMFGSVFGVEFHALLLDPGGRGNINMLLLGAIVIGVILILITMTLNIANGVKSGRGVEALVDPNGVAGVTFYGTVLIFVLLIVIKNVYLPWYVFLIALFPLLVIGLRHSITGKIKDGKKFIHGGIGMFIFEAFIEMFEAVLSYFTNTVSFVRVGAFALSHASLMGVVRMLAGGESGSLSIPVMVFGNLLVLGLEGLIVGIQVLRIEFYEIFSRFYEGKGREFVPFNLSKR